MLRTLTDKLLKRRLPSLKEQEALVARPRLLPLVTPSSSFASPAPNTPPNPPLGLARAGVVSKTPQMHLLLVGRLRIPEVHTNAQTQQSDAVILNEFVRRKIKCRVRDHL